MSKVNFKSVTVSNTETITPNMQRITLEAESLKHFDLDCEGNYIKLLFSQSGETDLSQLKDGERPVMRTYTIRRFLPQHNQIELDVVRHITQDQNCGFAARWAASAKAGDTINISGPGNIASMKLEADWFFMAADMTSLPALSAKIRKLPQDASGYAVIKVLSEEDIQPLQQPKNMEVIWVTDETPLADKVKTLPWQAGEASVWCACEFDDMRQLRQYFRNEQEVARDNIYISSYWKQGVTEDGHKVIKRQDAQQQESAA